MKDPLHYQMTEYDCGPMTFINAIQYLFDREEIMPEVLRYIIEVCTRSTGLDGRRGTQGTPREALYEVARWLHKYGRSGLTGAVPVDSRFIIGEGVNLENEHSELVQVIRRGGVSLIHVFLEVGHYALLTNVHDGKAYIFDPYYVNVPYTDPDIQLDLEHPYSYNRVISIDHLEYTGRDSYYMMGPYETREAVLIWHRKP